MTTTKITICMISLCMACTGCVQVCDEKVLEYTPIPVARTVPVKAGMEVLTDARENKDVKALKDVLSIPEKLTYHICTDFRNTRLFTETLIPFEQEEVDVIVRGRILKLFWQNEASPIVFVPYAGMLARLCGAPTSTAKGRAKIEVSLHNARTGELIATYVDGREQEIEKTMYTPTKPSLGYELTNSISEAMGSIKRQIQADREKIIHAAGKPSPKGQK